MITEKIRAIIKTVRQEGREQLDEFESKQILTHAGLDATREEIATSEDEAVAIAGRLGFPVVLKIVSPDILHKTEAGGVKVELTDAQTVRKAYQAIMDSVKAIHPDAKIQGILVQEMVQGGVETIIGVSNRPPFGPVVAFGLGGVFVEIMKDVTFRFAPVDHSGALKMLEEIKGVKILEGFRGQEACNKDVLAQVIAKVSELAVAFNEEIEELDINPLLIKGDRAIALDAVISLKKEPEISEVLSRKEKPANDIRAVLQPRSVAVIGASTDPQKTGHVLLKNIIVNGFPGDIYPINPNADEILGLKAYPNVLEVPGHIDLVFFLLPGKFIPTLFKDCKEKGVKAAVIIAAGFAEIGSEGIKAQNELKDLIDTSGVRCLGPNSIGFINTDAKLMGSFILFENWEDGPIALAGQSGIFAGAIADQIMKRSVQRLGIGKSIIFGNKIDLDESDFLEWAWQDSKTKIIAIYLEGMNNPRRFFSLADQVKKDKPIIVLKPGRTKMGAKASTSHTGSLALDDTLVDQGFKQYGITRADNLEEFMEFMKAFSFQPMPKGKRVGMVTFSGANGVMASDELSKYGFELAEFTPKTAERAKKILPEWQPVTNPLDLWAALGSGNRLTHEEGLYSVLEDENVDAVLVILLALANADFDGIRDVFAKARELKPDKPIYVVALGGEVKDRWMKEMEGLKIPIFENSHIAIKSLTAAYKYEQNRKIVQPDPILSNQ